jgi:hypothetical protein
VSRLEPESDAYHLVAAVRVRGALDVRLLRGALGAVLLRHEALRTSFSAADGAPVQQVHPRSALSPAPVDLGRLPAERRSAEAHRVVARERARPFRLEHAPLLRVVLLRLDPREHVLALVLHHIVGDDVSLQLILGEWAALYGAAAEGRPPALPEPGLQYADYAVWERAEGRVEDEALAYWRAALAGLPQELGLPMDRPGGSAPAGGGWVGVAAPPAVAAAVGAVGRAVGATRFMALLAALQVLLHHLTGRTDVAVGSPVTERERPELARVVGSFVNTLVLRADLSGNPTFVEAAARVRGACLGAFAHRRVPYERVVEELRRGGGGLFEVTFTFRDDAPDGADAAGAPGLVFEPFESADGPARGRLHLDLSHSPDGGLEGVLAYDRGAFLPETGERIARLWSALLETVAAGPGARLDAIRAALDRVDRDRAAERERDFRQSRLRSLRGVTRRVELPAAAE